MSGGDTNIKGAQVTGKGITVRAANLNIESLQDTADYRSRQQNISAQVTVGYGASASGDYSQSKINAEHRSVSEQSGLFAGEDGFDVQVSGHTNLTGGIITSAQSAEAQGKNRFQSGSISQTDLHNISKYDGSSIGFGASVALSGETLGQGTQNNSKLTTVADKNSQGFNGVGYGRDSDHQESTTHSGIGTRNIILTDEAGQLAKTGYGTDKAAQLAYTDIRTEDAGQQSGSLKNRFDSERVLKELNLQVEVTKDFRKNSFNMIDSYADNKQAELREKIKQATTEDEKTELYKEIYKVQYQRRFLETLVNLISANPDVAITQGTLQLANTKMREISLANSRQSPGIEVQDENGETKIINNVSYESGAFDGVKLGGVRLDLDIICGKDNRRCQTDNNGNLIKNQNGNHIYKGDKDYPTFDALLKSKDAKGLYGMTGGFQPIQGGWYFNGKPIHLYKKGSWSDRLVEAFSGTHDYSGGQIWGWYGKDGNTSRNRGKFEKIGSGVTAGVAIPVSAPFALSDFISSDLMQLIFKLGK